MRVRVAELSAVGRLDLALEHPQVLVSNSKQQILTGSGQCPNHISRLELLLRGHLSRAMMTNRIGDHTARIESIDLALDLVLV